MKFCQECGTQLNDTAKFCVKCGTPCEKIEESSISTAVGQSNFSKYYGLTFKDIFGKIIELTPHGVHIYRHKAFSLKFDNIIPYKNILNLNLAHPSISGTGYLSIVTANGGLKADIKLNQPISFNAAQELSNNQNVIAFRKVSDIQAIYDALTAILNG